MNLLYGNTALTNINSKSNNKLISNKNSAYELNRNSSYDEENNPNTFYDNYYSNDFLADRASPDYLTIEDLIDRKIPIRYQSPSLGENERLAKNQNSNSNTNIDKLNNCNANLNVGNYLENNEKPKYSNKSVNEINNLNKNQFINIYGEKCNFNITSNNINFINQMDHLVLENKENKSVVNRSFLVKNTNVNSINNNNFQYDNISNHSQRINTKTNLNIGNQIITNDITNKNHNPGNITNFINNKEYKNRKVEIKECASDFNHSASIQLFNNDYNKLPLGYNKNSNLEKRKMISQKEIPMVTVFEKISVKKRNLLKIFGKSILSVKTFLFFYKK